MAKSILHMGGIPLTFGKIPICLDDTEPRIPLWEFITESYTPKIFNPKLTINTYYRAFDWDFGDGEASTFTLQPIHEYLISGNKTVKLFNPEEELSISLMDIASVEFDNVNVVGELDFSEFKRVTLIKVPNNPKLTSIIFPEDRLPYDIFTQFHANSCNLTGTLDLSKLINISTQIVVFNNPNLTQIINPSSTNNVNVYHAYNCNLTGTLDLRNLENLGSDVRVNNNPNLTQILNPSSSRTFNQYSAFNCNLTGTLDVSGLTGLGGIFYVYNNPNLTQILNPISPTFTTMTAYAADYCNLTGTLEFIDWPKFGGTFNVRNNPNLTKIVHTVSNETSTWPLRTYNAAACNLTGTLDISCLTNFGGDIITGGSVTLNSNPNLNTILNPSTSGLINLYYANNCDLTGTLDLSMLTGLGGTVELQYNPNLHYIINPSSNQAITTYNVSYCDLIGTLDISGFTGIKTGFTCAYNPQLTSILLPNIIGGVTQFNANGCALNITTVDDVFSKMNEYYSSNTPQQNTQIYISGGTNSWPTGSLDNVDIVNLQTIFNNAGKTLTISINIEPETPSDEPILSFYTEASTNEFKATFIVS